MSIPVISESLSFEIKESSHPSYRLTNVLPMSNQSETLLSGATVNTQFELPNRVYNLSRSTLDFRMDFTKTASEYINSYSLGCPIDSIILSSREGTEIFRCENDDIYTATVLPYVTRLEDFLSYPKSLGNDHTTIATAQAESETTGDRGSNFFPNGEALADTTPAVACGRNGTRLVAGLAAANDMAYTEMQYFRQGTLSENVCVNFSFPLGQIAPHTLASIDKDMYFGQNLLLNINWLSKQNTGFATTSAATLSAGLAVVTADITVNNIRIRLAVETNQKIANLVMEKVASGNMKLYIPFVKCYTSPNSASTSVVHQQKLNSTNGQRLLCIYNVLAHTTASLSTRHDKSNLIQIKTTSLQNSINSFNLTENRLDLTKNELWESVRDVVKSSCIQGSNVFSHNEVNLISFRDGPSCDWLKNDCIVDGVDLMEEQLVVVDRTTVSAAYRSYMFVVTQKILSIEGGSISVR